jgi:two-component system phosphate regulon sensor histidine kinase PhoR
MPVANKIFWKLAVPLLLLAAVLLGVADISVSRALRRGALGAAGQHLQAVGRLLESRTMHPEDSAALSEWSQWSSGLDVRVTVFAPDGRVLADASGDARAVDGDGDTAIVRQAFTSGKGADSIQRSIDGDRQIYYRALVYRSPGSSAVVVRTAVLVGDVGRILWPMRLRLWGSAILLLTLVLAVASRYSRQCARSLEELSRRMEGMGAGEFGTRDASGFPPELAPLARAASSAASGLEKLLQGIAGERDFSAAVLDGMTEGVAVVGAGERIGFANRAFAEAFGATEDCRGRPLLEVVRQPDLRKAVQDAAARGEIVRTELEFGTVRPRTFSVTAAPVSATGVSGAVLVLHDVSEIRRLERVRRDFVANVSHELRTPLTTIQGFAETLLGGALDDRAARRRFVEIIREHAERLSRITDDLLKLSAIEGGMMTFRMEPVSVPQLVEHCLEAVCLKAEARGLRVTSVCPGDLPQVRGDSLRLEEVLKNLLENAVQYTPSGGSVCVNAKAEDSRVVLCVEDSGIGIPSTEQERIFERFYRVDVAHSRETGGTGLGLSIAKHIVEAHQGRIWVESELGRGSRFFVSLPVWPGATAPQGAGSAAGPEPSLRQA